MAAMEQQLRAAPTKADINTLVSEIKGVKETVIRNTDRIDTLFDLRKQDGEMIVKRMEKMVDEKLAGSSAGRPTLNEENERDFLRSRSSVRLWPVQDGSGLDKGFKRFLTFYLKMPAEAIESLTFVQVSKQGQARRSKIHDEVLVVLQTAQQRDTIQSFATNLASAQGQAGLRLDIPDYLRGLFRLFEAHAAPLWSRFGVVKRAIRFDDVDRSLYMDVKLEDTAWHKVSAAEMRSIASKKGPQGNDSNMNATTSSTSRQEKKRILFMEDADQEDLPQVESDQESTN